jgi:hypothetical protein
VSTGRVGLAVFFAGFMLAALLWTLSLSALIAVTHRHTGAGFSRAANLVAAAVLAFSRRRGRATEKMSSPPLQPDGARRACL